MRDIFLISGMVTDTRQFQEIFRTRNMLITVGDI